ncbi:peptidoglycan recognition protein family protein [Lolliginicoccus levis]|uniref:peptidoglycan recognition protein family protein n=1 Tax=Lolliginicoccus levis TaxID=2919542 RepID=UPI00241F6245|nr:peptidoglycan recognition family protein [Lolliginicoccus levis]
MTNHRQPRAHHSHPRPLDRRGFMIAGSSAALGLTTLGMASLGGATAHARTTPALAADEPFAAIPLGTPSTPPPGGEFVGMTFERPTTAPARVRFASGGALGRWHALHPSSHCPDSVPLGISTDLLRIPDGCTGIEVAHDDTAAGASAMTISGGVRPIANAGTTTDFLGLPVVTRPGWGAQTSLVESPWQQQFTPAQMITVHHSASAPWSTGPASVRAIYRYHAWMLGWGDVGYHLLIDPAGAVYAGRDTGSDASPVFQPGTTNVVTAGHSYAVNGGNIGICVVGDYETQRPSAAAQRSLVTVLAALCQHLGMDAAGRLTYVEPDFGSRLAVPTIAQHRDLNDTSCPGDGFTAIFGALRAVVPSRMESRRAASENVTAAEPPAAQPLSPVEPANASASAGTAAVDLVPVDATAGGAAATPGA